MKKKNLYGLALLVLAVLLISIGGMWAKYVQNSDVGTVTLDITVPPPVLSASWKSKLTNNITTLVLDSFTDENGTKKYASLEWEEGKPVGSAPFENGVRLFEVQDDGGSSYTAYILAQNANPVTFPENSEKLFYGSGTKLSSTNTITFKNVDTSKVISMKYMFSYCNQLTSLDLRSFNTSNVTDMSYMFYLSDSARSLTSLNVSNFDTSNVTDMKYMFSNCWSLTSLNVSNFDTSNVTNMSYMFYNCRALTSLDLSSFNTANVTDMTYMFYSCSKLTSLDVSSFDTKNVTNMTSMFANCSQLTNLCVSNFNTAIVKTMNSMFDGCSKLINLDLSNFNTANVMTMERMFYCCAVLTSLNVSSFDTTNVTNMNSMFCNCWKLTSLDLSRFDTTNVTSMSSMFNGCYVLRKVMLGISFKFVGTDGYLRIPDSWISGADGTWYVDRETGMTPAEVATYQATVTKATTYYAVKSEAPAASPTSFSLVTDENGTINGTVQGKETGE